MIEIHVFNPEHDIALASNLEHFTAPHAGRQLRNDISFLPALYAHDGDFVVVEDIDAAESAFRRIKMPNKAKVEFCTMLQLPAVLASIDAGTPFRFSPWGWDLSIRHQFIHAGVPETCLPSKEAISTLRTLSGRQLTTPVLQAIRQGLESLTVGESTCITSPNDFNAHLHRLHNAVAKAPWSSSGRGVRYFLEGKNPDNAFKWVENTIERQGSIMLEPLYNKVKDFGMEFEWHSDGTVTYLGLSLFSTVNGAYTGNILATEQEKRDIMSRYLSPALLDDIVHRLCATLSETFAPLAPHFTSLPFGVDMMIVANDDNNGFLLHPCVEINLRRTMGHVALALSPDMVEMQRRMQVVYENSKYRIRLTNG